MIKIMEYTVKSIEEPIDVLTLSTRAMTMLHRTHIDSLGDLFAVSREELKKTPLLGEKSLAELDLVRDGMRRLTDSLLCVRPEHLRLPREKRGRSETDDDDEHIRRLWKSAAGTICEITPINDFDAVYAEFKKKFSDVHLEQDDEFSEHADWVKRLFTIGALMDELVHCLIDLVNNHKCGIAEDVLKKKPGVTREVREGCGEIVKGLLEIGVFEYAPDGSVVRNLPSITEYVNRLRESDQTIVNGILSGKTLEEIGRELGITRERVRQRKKLLIEKLPEMKERFYGRMFASCSITREEFSRVFGLPDEIYNYLEWKYGKGTADLEFIMTDKRFTPYFRDAAREVLYRDCINLGGKRAKRTRANIINWLLKNYAVEDTITTDFLDLYNKFLKKHGLENDKNLAFTERYLENRLSENRRVLYKRGKCFRYYDIDSRDYSELYRTLNLEQYKDVEYSTLKFFRENRALMESYDIRDEYELHNLLKKLYGEKNAIGLKFGRMPHLEFGNVDRSSQVLDFLMEYAPISAEDLSRKYEEAYGIKREVALNYFRCIDEYCYNGVYSVDYKDLPENESARMKEVLSGDFYTISDVRRIYQREFPNSKISQINSYTLKMLGFKVYSGYVVNGRYLSVTKYIEEKLTRKNIIDLRTLPEPLLGIGVFYSQLGKHKRDLDIVEFAPKRFVHIRRLNELGITREMLVEFIRSMAEQIKPGDYFTTYSLRKRGQIKMFPKLKYDEFFYASLIESDTKSFSNCRVGIRNAERLFVRGTDNVSMAGFLHWLIGDVKEYNMLELEMRLETEFGIVTDRHRIIEALKYMSMRYERRTKMIYACDGDDEQLLL